LAGRDHRRALQPPQLIHIRRPGLPENLIFVPESLTLFPENLIVEIPKGADFRGCFPGFLTGVPESLIVAGVTL
jgi:hypothetical protein